MREHLVDRVTTEGGRTKFLKKIGDEKHFTERTASLSSSYVFIFFLLWTATLLTVDYFNFCLLCLKYCNRF